MNDKNSELFFGEEEDVVLTLTDEDGVDTDVQLIAAFEIDEYSQEYVAALVLDETGEPEDGEVILFHYNEDEEGNPDIGGIEKEEEYEVAAQVFRQILEEGDLEGIELEDEDDEEDGYLDDIGDIIPGISIEKEE